MLATDTADIYTNFTGLAELRAQAKHSTPEAKREVAEQFEALFLQMMLKSMRTANIHEGLLDNDQSEFYQQMFDQQIALSISSSNSIGLADVIYRQLGGDDGAQLTPPSVHRMPYIPNGSLNSPVHKLPWDDAESFVQHLYPTAGKVASELNTSPNVILSIAALETGWGKHVMKDAYGSSSYNLFGIKANSAWQGKKVASMTMEYEGGAMVKKREYFRAYDKPEESVADFANFLKANPRYQDVINGSQNPEQFVSRLKKAGYATDPKYDSKINSILNGELMEASLSSVKHHQSIF